MPPIVFFLYWLRHCNSWGQKCQVLPSLSIPPFPSCYNTVRALKEQCCSHPRIFDLLPNLFISASFLSKEESKDCIRPYLHELHLGGCVSPGIYSHACLLDVLQLDTSFPPKIQHRAKTEPLPIPKPDNATKRGKDKQQQQKNPSKVLSFESHILSRS